MSDTETINSVTIHRYRYSKTSPLINLISQIINSRKIFNKILTEAKPSLINFHHALPSLGIVKLKSIKNIPKVFTFYGPWGEEYRARDNTSLLSNIHTKLMLFFEKYVISKCRSVLVLSEFSKFQLKRFMEYHLKEFLLFRQDWI